MMMADDVGHGRRAVVADRQDDAFADHRMLLHAFPFDLLKRGRLAQNLVGNADLAQIVELGAEAEQVQFAFGELEMVAEFDRQRDHPFGMPPRVMIALTQGDGQRAGDVMHGDWFR
jgi:hypothetical protein